jgi:N-acetylmuramoyl-L-alanine amidase
LNWISRFIAPIGSIAAALAAFATATPARADAPIIAIYAGQPIRFSHVSSRSGSIAIGVEDPGFAALLKSTGSLLTWKPGERYVLITTSEPTVVSFAIGDRRYDVGPIVLQASFAPYERGSEVFLPFNELLRALDLALRQDGAERVLQPQLATLDVRSQADRVTLLAHGGAPLRPRVVQQTPSSVTYEFDGVGTSLTGMRRIDAGGVRSVTISTSGTVTNPVTLVTVQLAPGVAAAAPQNNGDRDVMLAFVASASSAQSIAEASPTPEPPPPEENAPEASASPSTPANGQSIVSGVSAQPSADGITVSIAVTGDASYEWHRLREPDNRFWVDIKNAQLQGPPIEESAPDPLVSIRVRQDDPTTVRVALSLTGPNSIAVTPSAAGLQVVVGAEQIGDEQPRSGSGTVGSVLSSSEQPTTLVTPAPIDNSASETGGTEDTGWKFGPRTNSAPAPVPAYVPTNPRLIVIDPGHGGSDTGTEHGGLREADLTLDMAKRLRDILVARGWEVKMTREADVDVYAPNDSARDELQARVDIANRAGARLFVSIHVNAFINAGPYGTTCYISKPEDVALARDLEMNLAQDGTKDDGIVKSHLYVTYHTRMPAVLVETAFLTNPSDYALLASAAWRQKVVEEIADGIAAYARENPAPSQPSQ